MVQRGYSMVECKQAGWYGVARAKRIPVPFLYDPHYLELLEPSEWDMHRSGNCARLRAAHRQEALDTGRGEAPAVERHRLLGTAEFEGTNSLVAPEPYGQAGERTANTMRQAREFNWERPFLQCRQW